MRRILRGPDAAASPAADVNDEMTPALFFPSASQFSDLVGTTVARRNEERNALVQHLLDVSLALFPLRDVTTRQLEIEPDPSRLEFAGAVHQHGRQGRVIGFGFERERQQGSSVVGGRLHKVEFGSERAEELCRRVEARE